MRGSAVVFLVLAVALAGCTTDVDSGTVDCDDKYATAFPGYTHEGYMREYEESGRAWFDADGDCFHDDDELELGTDPENSESYPRGINGVDSTDPEKLLVRLESSKIRGNAPLLVSLSYAIPVGNSPDVTWTLVVDGNATIAEGTGDDAPGDATHTFDDAGSYQITFKAELGDDQSSQTIGVTVVVPFVCESANPDGSFTVNDNALYSREGEVWQETNGREGLQVRDDQDCEPDTKLIP